MGRKALGVTVLLAAACAAWLLLGGEGGGPAPPSPQAITAQKAPAATVPGKGTGPTPAASPADAAPAGIVEGMVYRDDKPAAATVTAWLLDRGPADPGDGEAWERWRESPHVFDGVDTEPRARTECGPDGKWTLRGLGPGDFLVEAVAKDGARGRDTVDLGPGGAPSQRPGGEVLETRIDLEPAPCSLRGHALVPGGAPWTGVVAVESEGGMPPPPVRTGADGRFRFEGLPRLVARVFAVEPGRCRIPGPAVLLPFEDEVTFTVGAGLIEVRGTVVGDAGGQPVPGASVLLDSRWWRHGGAAERTKADEEGRFLVHVEDGASYEVMVEVAGFLPARAGIRADRPDPAAPLEVRLLRPGVLEGRVIADGTGVAVAGVPVIAIWADPAGHDMKTSSDVEGRYSIRGISPGKSSVLAFGNGWVSKDLAGPARWSRALASVDIPDGGSAGRDLVVVPAARLRGRVVDADNRGVAGVLVEGRVPPEPDGRRDRDLPLDLTGEWKTGRDGGFEVPLLLPGVPYRFTAVRDGVRLAGQETQPAAPGSAVEVVLRLPPERRLPVRVVDAAEGRPLPGMEVSVSAWFFPDEDTSLHCRWTTGEDGTVLVGPLPAVYLRVSIDGVTGRYEGASAEVNVSQHDTIEIRVARADAADAHDLLIEGTVLSPDGNPAPGVEWRCRGVDDFATDCFGGPDPVTDFRGRFRAEGLRPGAYRVRATAVRGGRALEGEEEVPAGARDVVVRLHDAALAAAGLDGADLSGRVRVMVLDAGGAPVPGGKVRAHFIVADGSEDHEEREMLGGRCAFPPPEGGAAKLWIEVLEPKDAGGNPVPLAHGLFGPFPVAPGEIQVRLAPESALEGRVVDASGAGVAGVPVSVVCAFEEVPGGEQWTRSDLGAAETGADGAFRIGGLAERAYRLTARPPRQYAPPDPLSARGGAKDLRLVLKAAAAPSVTVLDYDGKPVADASVRVSREDREDDATASYRRTSSGGIVRIEGLDPDLTYDLEVMPYGRADLLPAKRPGWKPADTTVRLEHGYELEVFVKDPGGRPLAEVGVTARDPGASEDLQSSSTDDEGRAILKRLRAGPVRVEASIPGAGGRPSRSAAVTAPAESGKAEIVLDPGGQAMVRVRGWTKDRSGSVYFAADEELEPTQAGVGDDGAIHLRGLDPGKGYNVFIREWSDENGKAAIRRCALLRGVKAGDPLREVDLADGKEITGKAVVPAGTEGWSVAALLGKTILFDGYPAEDGTFRIPAMPDGEWAVVVYFTAPDGRYHAGTGKCAAGGTVEIRVP
jgi:hypothetical protein